MSARRLDRAKEPISIDGVAEHVGRILDTLQADLFAAARERRDRATHTVDTWDDFRAKTDATAGFLLAHWCGDAACEDTIKNETKATIRCLTFDQPAEAGRCIRCDGDSARRVHFAKAY